VKARMVRPQPGDRAAGANGEKGERGAVPLGSKREVPGKRVKKKAGRGGNVVGKNNGREIRMGEGVTKKGGGDRAGGTGILIFPRKGHRTCREAWPWGLILGIFGVKKG